MQIQFQAKAAVATVFLFDTPVARFQATNTSGCMTSNLENEHEKAGRRNTVSDTLSQSIRRN